MKKFLSLTLLAVILLGAIPFQTAGAKTTERSAVRLARVQVYLELSQKVAGIDVNIPTLLYTAVNLDTNETATAYNSNLYLISVQEGDEIYLNTLGSPLSITYTVTAADVAAGFIHVSVLS